MGLPPIRKTLEGLLQDLKERLDLVERRLAKGGSGSGEPMYDSGWVDLTPFISWQTGWSLTGGTLTVKARRVGAVVNMVIRDASAAAGTFNIPLNGNITNSNLFSGVPAEFCPATGQIGTLTTGSTGQVAAFQIGDTGTVSMTATVPDATQTASVANPALTFTIAGTYLGQGDKALGTQAPVPTVDFVLPNRLGGPDGDMISMPADTDLNTVLATGWYVQRLSANATVPLNYPINRAGHLEVQGGFHTTGADTWLQTYTEYAPVAPSTASRQWRRTHYNGTWTSWALLSDAAPAFPPPIRYAPGNVNNVVATAWAILPGTAAQSMTVDRPLWVLVTFGAWVQASAGETRAGVELGGATVVSPANVQQDGLVGSGAWGQNIQLSSTDATNTAQRTQQRLYKLNAGTTTFTIEAYLATAGTHQVNYPVLEVIPMYWDGTSSALPAANAVVADIAGVKMCSGSFTIAAIAPDAAAVQTPITFPVGFFAAPPLNISVIAANGRLNGSYASLTKDGVTILVNNWSPGNSPANTTILWTAIGV